MKIKFTAVFCLPPHFNARKNIFYAILHSQPWKRHKKIILRVSFYCRLFGDVWLSSSFTLLALSFHLFLSFWSCLFFASEFDDNGKISFDHRTSISSVQCCTNILVCANTNKETWLLSHYGRTETGNVVDKKWGCYEIYSLFFRSVAANMRIKF